MSDQSAADHFPHARTPRTEFKLYLAIIFVVTLVIELIALPIRMALSRRLPDAGPIARASRLAAEITPMIFWP